MQTKLIERYFFFGLLLATFIFNFFIFKPFWIVLVLGASFSIILYPIYRWFKKAKMKNWLASMFTVFLFIIILCGPLFSIGVVVFKQTEDVYTEIITGQNLGPFIDSIGESVNEVLPPSIHFSIEEKISNFVLLISNNMTKIFSSTLTVLFSFLLMLLVIFYFLKDGPHWKKAIVELSPLNDLDDQKILDRLSSAVNGVVKGYLLIALIQGTLMGVGLWIFGVPNPALWGVVAGISALVPMVGTALIAVPAIIFIFITNGFIFALGFTIWAVLIVGLIDNLLNPIIIGSKVNIPPLLILFSVLGGIAMLGPVGILVGPLAMSLLYALISIYKNEFR